MKNPLKTFGPNLFGRDFVIGDLHGAMPAFQNLLREIHFDPTKDRMFSVGDLVDRGPNSVECLELIREPWFHCVLSNHEQMMLEAFTGGRMGAYWIQNGGDWGYDALMSWKRIKRGDTSLEPTDEEANIFDLVNLVDELPFLITVENRSGKKFHILHAELPPAKSYTVTDEMLADPDTVMKLAKSSSGDGDAFLWARSVWYPFYGQPLTKQSVLEEANYQGLHEPMNAGRSMIISGHTILQQPVNILSLTNIDNAAYASCSPNAPKWAGLVCINLDTWEFYKATPSSFAVVEPIAVNKVDMDYYDETEK